MAIKPPPLGRFDQGCVYLRKRRGSDDFIRQQGEFEIIANGVLSLDAKSGADVEIADGLENIVTYEAWDRWKSGISPADLIELADGRRLNIRRIVNWEERNEYLWMTVVHRVPVIAGLEDA